MDSLSDFRAEFRIPPKPVLVATTVVTFLLPLIAELLAYPRTIVDSAIVLFLAFCLATAVNWGLSHWQPVLEPWLTLLEILIAANAISVIFDEPAALALAAVPIALAVPMVGFRAALLLTVVETLSAIAWQVWLHPASQRSAATFSILVIWGVVAVLGRLWYALRELTGWMNSYFERGQEFLEQARDRKAELEQTLESLASANRQLALATERSVALRTIAEEAQQSKTMFVANVSHEFRTPLNMIIGLVELMVESPDIYDVVLPPKMREDLNVVYRNCEHLSGMINDVLDLSRIESNRLILHRERVWFAEIVESCAAAVRPLIQKKALSMRIDLADSVGFVYCDRVRIRQVLLNLLSNAARFTDEGEISIVARAHDHQILVTVADTGPGIAPHMARRIFEPFRQDPNQMWREKGSGLGLSISKRFVQLHGGEMWLESEQQSGTAFSFTLPISAPIEHTIRPNSKIQEDWLWRESSFIAGRLAETDTLTKPCVIVHDLTDALHSLLGRYVDEAEFVDLRDLGQLRRTVRERPAQVVAINARTLEELWSLMSVAKTQVPDTPVVGFCLPHPATRAFEAGATEYLTKPVKSADLLRAFGLVEAPVKRVLIADDDPEFSELLRRMLLVHDSKLEVISAHSGRDALRELQRTQVDLLLLDVVMPDMNGWEVLEAMLARNGVTHPPTIFVSAQDPVDQPQRSELLVASLDRGLDFRQLLKCSLRIPELLTSSEPEPDLEPA